MSDAMRDYVDVAERISIFRSKYPNGSLQPANLDKPFEIVTIGNKTYVVCVAAAYRTPDDPRPGIGMAWEPVPAPKQMLVNSELMNCETSAWGRAIVATLAADTKRVASADEVRNREGQHNEAKPTGARQPAKKKAESGPADAKKNLVEFAKQAGIVEKDELRDFCAMTLERDVQSASDMTAEEIAQVIVALKDLAKGQ